MRLQIVSDTHYERLKDAIEVEDVDVLVLAGDLGHSPRTLKDDLLWASDNYEQVLYVPGNHEYYGLGASSIGEAKLTLTDSLGKPPSNVTWSADPFVAAIMGKRFVVTTLWSSVTADRVQYHVADYRYYKLQDLNDCHAKNVQFLELFMQKDDIVLTHHLPSYKSVAPCYTGSVINQAFASDLEYLMDFKEPAVWVHGHSHHKVDYMHRGTRVVSNPYGYASEIPEHKSMCIEI